MVLQKVKLGRTGYRVSPIGFGALPIQRLSTDEAVELLRASIRLGLNFIDSANMYGDSEVMIGKALQGAAASEIILATKSLARDAETIFQHVELSRTRMKSDFIHIYQLHAVNDSIHLQQVLAPGGALEGLKKARDKGWVGSIGITGHRVDVLIEALKTGEFATVQVPYNFIETEPEHELFPLARERGIGIIAMKPLGGGMLNDATISLKYILQQPQVIPIPGFESIGEVEEILEIAGGSFELLPVELQGLKAISAELGKRFCRRCNYCAPCPQEIQIPQAMILNTLLKRLGTQHFITGWGKDALEKSATCTQCGACLPRCPYRLPIPEIIAGHVRDIRNVLPKHVGD